MALVERFAPERQLGRLKEFTHYFARNYAFGHHLASRVQSSGSAAQAWAGARAFFAANDPAGADPSAGRSSGVDLFRGAGVG